MKVCLFNMSILTKKCIVYNRNENCLKVIDAKTNAIKYDIVDLKFFLQNLCTDYKIC